MLPPTAVELTSVPGCMTSKSSPSMVTSIHSRSPSGSSSASSALRFEALNGDATRTRSPGSARVSAHASWHRIVRSFFFQPSARSPSVVVAAGSQSSAPAFASPHGRTRRSSRPSIRDTETTRNAPSAAPSASTRHSRASRSRRAASEKKEGSRSRESPRRTEAASFGAAFGAATSTFGAAVSLPVTLVAAVWRPPRASTATPPPRARCAASAAAAAAARSKSASGSSPQSHSNGFFGSGGAEVRRAGAVGGCRGTIDGCCAATTSVVSTRVGPGSNRSDGSGSDGSGRRFGGGTSASRLAEPGVFCCAAPRGPTPMDGRPADPGVPAGSAHIAWTSARSAAAATFEEERRSSFPAPSRLRPRSAASASASAAASARSSHVSSCSQTRRLVSSRALACCIAAALPRPMRRSWCTTAPPARLGPAPAAGPGARNRGGETDFHDTTVRASPVSSSTWLRGNPSGASSTIKSWCRPGTRRRFPPTCARAAFSFSTSDARAASETNPPRSLARELSRTPRAVPPAAPPPRPPAGGGMEGNAVTRRRCHAANRSTSSPNEPGARSPLIWEGVPNSISKPVPTPLGEKVSRARCTTASLHRARRSRKKTTRESYGTQSQNVRPKRSREISLCHTEATSSPLRSSLLLRAMNSLRQKLVGAAARWAAPTWTRQGVCGLHTSGAASSSAKAPGASPVAHFLLGLLRFVQSSSTSHAARVPGETRAD